MGKSVGLRTEILMTLALLMGAALLFGGVMLLRMTEKSLIDQRLNQLDGLSQTLVLALVQASAETPVLASGRAAELLRQLPLDLNSQGWWLYDGDLELLDSSQNGSVKPFAGSRRRQVRFAKESFQQLKFPSLLGLLGDAEPSVHYALPLMKDNRFLGLLEIRYSLDDIRYRLLSSQKMIILYVLLYGTVLVLIGYYLLQRNVITPARKLLQATEEVSRGDLDNRLQPDGPLEIAQLAEAYNRMVEALSASRQETSKQIDALEETNHHLKQAREELLQSEKMASVGQLAAGLAHELGNPLAALIGYLSLLQERIQPEADSEIVARSIIEAERIDFLVRELLDFSRPEDCQSETLDPAVELRKCIDLLQHQGSLSNVAVNDKLPASLPFVTINSRKLQQVYVNLLLNAVQACSGDGQITLSAAETPESISIQIADNGCGIAESELAKVFDPFYTTKPPGQGTGLGLSVCHRIVDEAGGKIKVDSISPGGSTFKVDLPVS